MSNRLPSASSPSAFAVISSLGGYLVARQNATSGRHRVSSRRHRTPAPAGGHQATGRAAQGQRATPEELESRAAHRRGRKRELTRDGLVRHALRSSVGTASSS